MSSYLTRSCFLHFPPQALTREMQELKVLFHGRCTELANGMGAFYSKHAIFLVFNASMIIYKCLRSLRNSKYNL